jgi:hypothetical protein
LVGWLSGFRAQTGSVAKATFVRRLREAAARLGRGVRAVPRLNIVYPGICLTTEENHGKSQGSRKVLGSLALRLLVRSTHYHPTPLL